jgi:hypothetical protein
MITFKCKDCGGLQYSSCLQNDPCIYCNGEIEVYGVEKKEVYENEIRRTSETIRETSYQSS